MLGGFGPDERFRVLVPGRDPGAEGGRPEDQGLASQPSQRDGPGRPRRGDQPSGAGLVRLLRGLLPLRAVLPGSAHRPNTSSGGQRRSSNDYEASAPKHAAGCTPSARTSPGRSRTGTCFPPPEAGLREPYDGRTVTYGPARAGRARLPPATHQEPGDQEVGGRAPAFPRALHADLLQLDQPGGTLVRLPHRRPAAPQRPPHGAGTRTRHPRLGAPGVPVRALRSSRHTSVYDIFNELSAHDTRTARAARFVRATARQEMHDSARTFGGSIGVCAWGRKARS